MSATNDYRINIFDWDISYVQLIGWIKQTGAEIVILSKVEYRFIHEEDFIAFKLAFETEIPVRSIDSGYYYCPYIPLIIKDV